LQSKIPYFCKEGHCRHYSNAKNISNWIMGDFSALLNKQGITIDKSRLQHPGKLIVLDMFSLEELEKLSQMRLKIEQDMRQE